jgi:hypothetical protein
MNATKFSGIGTTVRGWFGNKYPSLLPSSLNFNLRVTSIIGGYRFGKSSVKRYKDNPRGFGAIPYVATYLESYASIAKSINELVYFRVPFPLNYEQTIRSYSSVEDLPGTLEPQNLGNSGSTFSTVSGPTSVSDIKNTGIKTLEATYSLRNLNGSLAGSSVNQGYSIIGNRNSINGELISNIKIEKYFQEVDLKLTGIDVNLADTAYANITKLLPSNPSSFATRITSQQSTTTRQAKADDDYYHGSNIKLEALTIDDILNIPSEGECIPGVSMQLLPPSLLPSPLFYNYKIKGSQDGGWTRGSLCSSSLGISLIETGFQIVRLETQSPQVIIN